MTLKLTEAERKIYKAEKLKKNMQNYYEKHREEHKQKCGQTILEKYKNDPNFRRIHIEKVKARQLLKKEFKNLCSIDFF
tara:strand:- start:922 stop:1158 length:237 start_codon:yes stop_codon:yes gene_type:complete